MSFLDENDDPAKIILIGESGAGKSGSVASLIAAGYKVRILDTDNGAKTIRPLLLDSEHYPYAKYMASHGIDPRKTVSRILVSTNMKLQTVMKKVGDKVVQEKLLAPADGRAWMRIIDALENWKDGENTYGHISTWDRDTVLVLDSFTTISRQAYYFLQAFNGRLGASEDGRTHQRDVGGAQSQLRRLLEMIYDPTIKCNIILICHINRIDDSRGYSQTPEEIRLVNPEAMIEVKGFPGSVGIALSKRVGIYFNDSFIVSQSGSGTNVKRVISTVPTTIDGVNITAKNSAYLEREYDVSTGLAQIFAALRGQPKPVELINALTKKPAAAMPPAPSPSAAPAKPLATATGRTT